MFIRRARDLCFLFCTFEDFGRGRRTAASPWGNEDTQQLIDILAKYNVKVTFFVVGEWVDKYPESVKALSDAGHEVMNHSNDHAHFNSLSAEEIAANINACSDKIEAVTGVRPTLFRPPYGEYDDHVITAVRGMGVEPIQWDVEALAAVGRTVSMPCFLLYTTRCNRLFHHSLRTKAPINSETETLGNSSKLHLEFHQCVGKMPLSRHHAQHQWT